MLKASDYEDLAALLAAALRRFAASTALVECQRRHEQARLSYAEFERQAELVACRLQGLGIGAGDRVAILMSNQSKWLLSAVAVFFRGAVVVPLDYKLSAEEQLALLQHCRPRLLICEMPLWQRLRPLLGKAAEADFDVWVSEAPVGADLGAASRWESLPASLTSLERVPRRRDDIACIVYSSGTGGRPKGCMLTHGNYLAQCDSLRRLFPLGAGDRFFSILPTNHAIDFMCGFIGPLCGGATVVHQRTLRPEFLLDTMQQQRITHMAVVPLLLTAFERQLQQRLAALSPFKRRLFELLRWVNAKATRHRPRPWLSRRLLGPVHQAFGGHLRLLFCGGAFVDAARAQFFYDLGLPVVIGYGLTEACTVVTVNDLQPFRADSVGRPLPPTEVEVRRSDGVATAATAAVGEVGEVFVRGPTVMCGYLDDPEQSAEVLQGGWLRTGDLGCFDARGYLHLVGRAKNMIVTAGGKNIYPEDIEGAFEGLPCEELAVFAENYVWSRQRLGDERLVGIVRGGGEGFEAALRRRNQRLPDFKRLQGYVEWQAAFPRTASMKLKREVLAAALRDQMAPQQIRPL